MKLTDAQWAALAPLLPQSSSTGRGRPRIDDRRVIDGILWVMKTGARWRDLPDRYPSPATCHRRFQAWNRSGLWAHLLKALADDLIARGGLDLSEGAIDATFAPAKRGICRRQDQARQGDQDHGRHRPAWFSSRHPRGDRFPARNDAG